MGLILDSSVLVAGERQGQNARQALEAIALKIGNLEIAISVVTVMELAHGVARANTPERQNKRRQFVDELMGAVPLHSIKPAIALKAGALDGESQARGVRIPLGRPAHWCDRARTRVQCGDVQSTTLRSRARALRRSPLTDFEGATVMLACVTSA
jgi:tRNA(fMet)-specific endonuclease VapC